VGERGPEIFVPRGAGSIVPNHALAAASMHNPALAGPTSFVSAPVVNITVEGGSRGDEADRELAGRIGREVQNTLRAALGQEIHNQMRPGGLLYRPS
jgi:phage-related minor tail protein